MKRFFIISALIACILIAGCTTSQTQGKGTLQFSSSPEGAQIYLDNQYDGTTPSTLSGVSAGTHTLEFRYQGYQSWTSNITVTTGTSTYYAALTPITTQTVQPTTAAVASTTQAPTSGALPTITIQAAQKTMILGNSQVFTGSCTGSDTVILYLSGPGAYTNGVQIAQVPVSVINTWNYTWNPGYRIISGSYTMIALDKTKTVSATAPFSVVGGGTVSIIATPIAVSQGGTVTFFGQCSTGAGSVTLTLYGPGQLASGIQIATLSLNPDNTYSYTYTFDISRPAGTYTMTVNDQQHTASASTNVQVSG
ncbi:PEGA domain-containing protein [Methanoregula sp.]|uniref:PEGA domain-containing protein n=1 Tax=Methanoregula sp. TaxID=2052170 RepID=UPI002C6ECDF9|nr:PEGA domain-containing protein [Methanoregula sp.]HVP96434.1 PEGA domain-containing protein [Methanoregula sp.]